MRRAALLCVGLLLFGCGDKGPKLSEGTVTDRRHEPAHVVHHPGRDVQRTRQDCGMSYNFMTERYENQCRTVYYTEWKPAWDEHVPDKYFLYVTGELKGKPYSEWVKVDYAEYQRLQEGDTWTAK